MARNREDGNGGDLGSNTTYSSVDNCMDTEDTPIQN
jgi:hypothetical protein